MLKIIGSPGSPYVRKVFAVLLTKGLKFEFDPIVPFFGNEEFERLSPLRRIPVLIDGDTVVNDSSVICEYLDDAYPAAPVFPAGAKDRARARWIEEYADSRMGDVMVWRLFYQRVIGPAVFGRETDQAVVAQAIEHDLPAIMDWIEAQAPEQGFLFGDAPMVADFALGAFFVNAAFARWTPDAARWPRAAALVGRIDALPAVTTIRSWADAIARTRVPEQRAALEAVGAPIWATSFGAEKPRAGVMPLG